MYEAAQKLFDDLIRDGLGTLNDWIASKQVENVHLDFKEKENPQAAGLGDSDRKNLRKAVSGFSNTAGGVIVWGIKTGKGENDYAEEAKPLAKPKGFQAAIESALATIALPFNSGIQNKTILSEDGTTGFVVTYIPYSDRPVRSEGSGDKNFYKRIGGSFVPLEVYDIEEMYGRRLGARVVPVIRFRKGGSSQDNFGNTNHYASIDIGLLNEGRGIAKFPFLIVTEVLGANFSHYGTSGNGPSDLPVQPGGFRGRYFGGVDHVIHPGLEVFGPRYDRQVTYVKELGYAPHVNDEDKIKITFQYGAEGQLVRTARVELNSEELREFFAEENTRRIPNFDS